MTKCSLFLNCFSVDVFVHVYELFVFIFSLILVLRWMNANGDGNFKWMVFFCQMNDVVLLKPQYVCCQNACVDPNWIRWALKTSLMLNTIDISQFLILNRRKKELSHEKMHAFSIGMCVQSFRWYFWNNLFIYPLRKMFHSDAFKRNINSSKCTQINIKRDTHRERKFL